MSFSSAEIEAVLGALDGDPEALNSGAGSQVIHKFLQMRRSMGIEGPLLELPFLKCKHGLSSGTCGFCSKRG